MFTMVPVSSIGRVELQRSKRRRHTIDVICPQTPRLYDSKCTNDETAEGIWDNLFGAASSGRVKDERVVIEAMESRGNLGGAWRDFPVWLVDE